MDNEWGQWLGGHVNARHAGSKKFTWSLLSNNLYVVTLAPFLCDWGHCVHLSVRRQPSAQDAPLGWLEKQRIKDELVGARVAIEVYPPKAEVVNQANTYHLWVMPDGFKLPFGLEGL